MRRGSWLLSTALLACASVACDPILGMQGTVRSAPSATTCAGEGSPGIVEISPPIEGVKVTMRCRDHLVLEAITNAAGQFNTATAGMAGEACTVRVEKAGYASRELSVVEHCRSEEGEPTRKPGACLAHFVVELEPLAASPPPESAPAP
ncbi:MAG: carboxypeptidase regulatory-like domain-containing protein [Labilithrix sp.]|nr:carboxypeptidase regulatory-like domain-containing protein [Labilithrix sp.]MBX3218847.1 carboxypeptidase regulatory-like domain-containing protein [Labilithrix sp.]